MKKLQLGPYAFSLAGNVIASSTGFVGIWALARIFTPEELGKWLLYLTAFTFGDMMRSGIIHTALVKYTSQKNKQKVVGSSWVIGLVLSVLLAAFVGALEFIINIFTGKYFEPELSLYLKLLILASFPAAISLWLQQTEHRFNRMLYIRLIFSIPLLLFILSGLFFPFGILRLLQFHLAAYMATSVLVSLLGWSSIQSIFQANIATIRKLFSFGKHTMGTLISTNLLKSTDTFMISWFFGPAVLAAYNLPYKLIELVEIPLRSLAATFLTQVAHQSNEQNFEAVKNLFYQYTGLLTLILLPVIAAMFVYAEEVVVMFGGQAFMSSTSIFRCFLLYSLFLPLDRFLGITLDILNKPHLNFIKVWFMVSINIAGNFVAIYCFASPLLIAVATISTTVCGVGLGWFTLNKLLHIQMHELISRTCSAIGQHMSNQPKSTMA